MFLMIYIYINKVWGVDENGEGNSGSGSIVKNNIKYLNFLNTFIKINKIKSIVDLGCGDWQLMSKVNLNGIKYDGYDNSNTIINKINKLYSKSNIKFHQIPLISKYKKADLLICKDVMQHINNNCIDNILSQLNNYKHSIIINDIDEISSNIDIENGGWRNIDIRKYPFNINVNEEHKLWDTEQNKTLFVINI